MIGDVNTETFSTLTIERTHWNEEFMVDWQLCAHLLRNERPFTRLLQRKQRPDIYNQSYYEDLEDKRYLIDTSAFDSISSEYHKVT